MSRVDVPTLKCDRCGGETQNLTEMAAFRTLTHYSQSHVNGGKKDWDLCPSCWDRFSDFMSEVKA